MKLLLLAILGSLLHASSADKVIWRTTSAPQTVEGSGEDKSTESLPLLSETVSFSEDGSNSIDNEDNILSWSGWEVIRQCSADCGGCGRIERSRTCLCDGQEGCTCSGVERRLEVCGTKLCEFPLHTRTCCEGYVRSVVDGQFKCVPVEIESDPPTCLGTWSDWAPQPGAACSADCGMCGQIVTAERKCEPEGCHCSGQSIQREKCGAAMCRAPKRTCCTGYVKGVTNRGLQCVAESGSSAEHTVSRLENLHPVRRQAEKLRDPAPTPPPPPPPSHSRPNPLTDPIGALREIFFPSQHRVISREAAAAAAARPNTSVQQLQQTNDFSGVEGARCRWSDWVEVAGECSDDCGMCGVREVARRKCEPEGCACGGPATRYEDCGVALCAHPRRTCCGTYTRAVVSNAFTCVDRSVFHARADAKNALKAIRLRDSPARRHAYQGGSCVGLWSEWVPVSPLVSEKCTDGCGLCGERIVAERTCEPAGCRCEGATKLRERCASTPCLGTRKRCCDGAELSIVDGVHVCREHDRL